MKKCSLCKENDAIAKIQWMRKQSEKTPFYVCIDCFCRVTTELLRAQSLKCIDSDEKRMLI